MNNYGKVEKINNNNINCKITNVFQKTNDKSQCNPFGESNNFGNYFEQSNNNESSAYWGSNKPISDKCLKPQEGIPINSLWNNSTKRKTIVYYER